MTDGMNRISSVLIVIKNPPDYTINIQTLRPFIIKSNIITQCQT